MSQIKKQPLLCELCKVELSLVGFNGVWVCLPCFEIGLDQVREHAEAFRKEMVSLPEEGK